MFDLKIIFSEIIFFTITSVLKAACLILQYKMYFHQLCDVRVPYRYPSKKISTFSQYFKRELSIIQMLNTSLVSFMIPIFHKTEETIYYVIMPKNSHVYPRPGFICEGSGQLRLLCCLCHCCQFGGLLQKGMKHT